MVSAVRPAFLYSLKNATLRVAVERVEDRVGVRALDLETMVEKSVLPSGAYSSPTISMPFAAA